METTTLRKIVAYTTLIGIVWLALAGLLSDMEIIEGFSQSQITTLSWTGFVIAALVGVRVFWID